MQCNGLQCALTVQCRGILWAVNTVELCSLCLAPGVLWGCNVTAVLTLRCAVFTPGCAVFELSDHLLCTLGYTGESTLWILYLHQCIVGQCYATFNSSFNLGSPPCIRRFSSFWSHQALIVPELFSVIFNWYLTSASGVILDYGVLGTRYMTLAWYVSIFRILIWRFCTIAMVFVLVHSCTMWWRPLYCKTLWGSLIEILFWSSVHSVHNYTMYSGIFDTWYHEGGM